MYALLPIFIVPLLVTASVRGSEHGGHNDHNPPLLELNETEITLYHSPTPPSYWSIDIDEIDPTTAHRHTTLITLHVLCLSLAFFVALPVAIAMRSARHRAHGLVIILFYFLAALGCAVGSLYTKSYPNMYEHSVHRPHGYLLLLSAVLLNILDVLPPIRWLLSHIRRNNKFVLKSFWTTVILRKEDRTYPSEYISLVPQESEEVDGTDGPPIKPVQILQRHHDNERDADTLQWANDVNHHRHHQRGYNYSQSMASEGTLFDSGSRSSEDSTHDNTPEQPIFTRIGHFIFLTFERAMVFAAYGISVTGIVVYTGGCRENYINGCMAHLIKGSIFWCYGLFTFARFLGTFAELGWAWNRAPTTKYPSGEFVESLVIFIYGVTNTWMERFGTNPGDPYTTKQIQHISIAVTFCFAGLVGMAIESRRIRNWLAFPSILASRFSGSSQCVKEPASYAGSFNPFPALVIGVTGAAMSAHHQTYLFQVQIHALWGNLLVAFSVLRCLTYFFLWLVPPKSTLPSRPPTETLGSFFLACGGLVFMLSTEEVTFAAMRRGRDDVMMFLNFAVAVTCFAFCWVMFVVAFKGWITSRMHPSITFQRLQSMAQS